MESNQGHFSLVLVLVTATELPRRGEQIQNQGHEKTEGIPFVRNISTEMNRLI